VTTADFTLEFAQNAGNVTGATIASLAKTTGGALTGGETTVRVNLNLTGGTPVGLASGVETITIKPASGTAIYERYGGAVAVTQSTGAKTLNDKLPPTIGAAFTVNNSAQPNTITVVASEKLAAAAANTPANWTVTNNGGTITYTIATSTLQADEKTVILTLAADPADNKTYITNADADAHLIVTPAGTITDLAGNAYAAGAVTGNGETLTRDIHAPTVTAALTYTDTTHASVVFSEKVDKTTAQVANNYVLSGTAVDAAQTVTTATLQADGVTVELIFSAAINDAAANVLTVKVSNVTDLAGNAVRATDNEASHTF
jgi:hypothetical protein